METEISKARVTLMVESLRFLLAINGGAAIALLTFWGNHSNDASISLGSSILAYAFGVAFGALSALLSYMAYVLGDASKRRGAAWCFTAGLVLSGFSVVAFILGCWWASSALG